MVRIATETGPQAVDIYPMHRYETGGWIIQSSDPQYHCQLDANEIGQILAKIMKAALPQIIPDEPSHV